MCQYHASKLLAQLIMPSSSSPGTAWTPGPGDSALIIWEHSGSRLDARAVAFSSVVVFARMPWSIGRLANVSGRSPRYDWHAPRVVSFKKNVVCQNVLCCAVSRNNDVCVVSLIFPNVSLTFSNAAIVDCVYEAHSCHVVNLLLSQCCHAVNI